MKVAIQSTLKQAGRWLDSQRPAHCSRAGWRSFQLGLVFLPTSALLAGLGLLGAISLWRPANEPSPLSRPLARWLLLLAVWMLVTLLATPTSLEVKLRLGNWLPFFWFALAARPYVDTPASRERLGLLVLVATVPALMVGLLQALLLFSGPWTGLWGLLNWDLPARFAAEGAGVFPNPNFTAAWYAMALPIAACQALSSKRRPWAIALLVLLAAGVVLSGSRTALVGATVGVLLLAWRRFWKPVLLLALAQAALVSTALLLPTSTGPGWLANRLSGGLASKFEPMLRGAGHTAAEAIAAGRDPYRSELFPQAVQFIHQHPLLGLAEPLLGLPTVQPPALLTHTHNVVFQLSIQHGLPAALLLMAIVGWLLLRAWQAVGPRLRDRALLASAVAAVWLHAYDIPSFDSRNNMLGWLLLSCCAAVAAAAPRATAD